MKKLLRKIFFALTFILIYCLLASNGFCATIDEIINDSPTRPSDNTHTTYYAIQIGVFSEQKDADNLIFDLKEKGYNPYIFQSVNSKGQTVYSTRIGKFDNYQTAASELTKFETSMRTLALITYYDSLKPVSSPDNSASDKTESIKTPSSSEKPSSVFSEKPSSVFNDDLIQSNESDEIFESKNLQILFDKINSLESEVNRLRDESDVRSQLTITEDEAATEEEDILEAAGREYTLTNAGNIEFSMGVSYAYSEYDAIKAASRVEDVADHTISTRLGVFYGLKDNVSLGVGIPFVYKYHKVGTQSSLETTDIGDLSLSWQLQPLKSSGDLPSIIVNGSFTIPVGRSPYEIAPGEELSTSGGLYSTGLGVSISQVSDPVVVFSSLNLNYSLPLTDINQKRDEGVLDEVDPGLGIGISTGMGYALSYKLNLNVSFSYSYSFESTYKYLNAPDATSGVGVSSTLGLGVGYKWNRDINLNFNIGIPLTNSRSFSFGFYTPIEFEL